VLLDETLKFFKVFSMGPIVSDRRKTPTGMRKEALIYSALSAVHGGTAIFQIAPTLIEKVRMAKTRLFAIRR